MNEAQQYNDSFAFHDPGALGCVPLFWTAFVASDAHNGC
jgi:hypothetical protein